MKRNLLSFSGDIDAERCIEEMIRYLKLIRDDITDEKQGLVTNKNSLDVRMLSFDSLNTDFQVYIDRLDDINL